MDWKRIDILQEEYSEIKGEPHEEVVRELLRYIQELRPRLLALEPPTVKQNYRQQTYLDFSRIPENTKQGSTQEVRIGKLYTDLENAIIRATHTRRLTDPQRDKLDKDVIIILATLEDRITETLPSPNDLYDKDLEFKKFADNKIKAMASYMASNGKIIDALAAYEHPQGWCNYRSVNKKPDLETPVIKTESGSGAMPGVKRVQDE